MADETHRTTEPHDRLTRLCDEMIKAHDAHPESGDEKIVIFIQDGRRGGIVMHGYKEDSEAIADLFLHLEAMFRANGKKLMFVPLGGDG